MNKSFKDKEKDLYPNCRKCKHLEIINLWGRGHIFVHACKINGDVYNGCFDYEKKWWKFWIR